ncbi:4-hydroxyphenylpyruvate dioxygenase [Bacillus horti]|uniref:4-hydroxyphenylpyruvate dioxygenase n=1 Tax=Caldalkalibacillus horti TaxID=77523 RepID=A0ABT9VWT1_9BACI|nr:4-hydroxyphenylpyruvate dioxygenase [Bacillus horti]MDQ0165451.1 4-hydroxyphenylpyruvate dioxygenase [Bacillus horti]
MEDFFPIKKVDYIELFVGNAKQAMHFYCKGFGFKPVAYSGLETKNRETTSYVLKQKGIRLIVTSSLSDTHPIADFVKLHGDGVKDIALEVDDVESAYNEAVVRGAIALQPPEEIQDEYGVWKKAIVGTYGDTIHSLIERKDYTGPFAPGYTAYHAAFQTEETGLLGIDHIVGNVELNKMEEWVSYYEKAFGFTQMIHFDDDDISTEYSALMSKVMQGGDGRIKFPINEPAEGKRKSQIQEYLDFYKTPGVQHIALTTSNIIHTVSTLRDKGVEFLNVPASYYEDLRQRVGDIEEEIKDLENLDILVDRDEEGYLLQIFTKPVVDRPTLFFEIIQRKGSRGFGAGNFKALFEAIEREQALRGNL